MRVTDIRDSVGGYKDDADTPVAIHTNLPCRINWSRAREKVMFGKSDYLRDAKLYCRVVDITEKDIIVYNGNNYNIVGLVNIDERNRQLVIDIIRIAE